MCDELTLEHECGVENCTNFAEFFLSELGLTGRFILRNKVCGVCEKNTADFYKRIRIDRSLSECWEIAEELGWINPIDKLFDKYGVDNPEDLPEHEQVRYPETVDEAERSAIDYIFKNFSDYVTVKTKEVK